MKVLVACEGNRESNGAAVGAVTPRPFTPLEYQRLIGEFMLDHERAALFAGMGTGKTVCSLTLIDLLHTVGNGDPVLVLGPLRVARDTWPEEAQKWQHTSHMTIVPVIGTPRERRGALSVPAHVHTMNYENLPWLIDHFEGKAWPFRTVFADESTRLKNFRITQGGVRARSLGKVAHLTDRWYNLTGTPAANGLKDLWGQFWFLDFGKRLGLTYTAFQTRWFTMGYDGVVKPTASADREIYERIDDITISIRAEDWFDVAKPIERTIPIHLPAAVRSQYKQLEKDMFTELACGTEIEVFNQAALTNKCRQFANGAAYTTHPAWAAVHDEKIDALASIVEEAAGAQILVSYSFVSDRERILKAFKSSVDISTPEGLKRFKNGHAQLGVAHPKSMGHGIDGLQNNCNILVYFGHDWNLEERMQILERIGPVRQKQAGLDRPVWVYSIVATDTIDEEVMERHASKRDVQDLLMEAMVKRGKQ